METSLKHDRFTVVDLDWSQRFFGSRTNGNGEEFGGQGDSAASQRFFGSRTNGNQFPVSL